MSDISEIATFISDGDWIESQDQSDYGIRLIQTGNIGNGEYLDKPDKAKYISEEIYNKLHCTDVHAGDILISRLPDPIGRSCIVPKTIGRAVTAVDCTILRVNINIYNPQFFVYYTQTDIYKSKLSHFLTGTTRKRISRKNLEKIAVPQYSRESQDVVVKKLDKITNLISMRKQQLEILDELIKSRFLELFGDLKLNSKNWKIFSFPEFALIDTQMIHDFHNYEDYPHIGIDSIEKDTGNILAYRTIGEDHVISGKYLFTANHIIYSKIRPNLNKVALPDFDGLCSADAYPILPIEGKSNRYFLAFILRSNLFLSYILAFSNRTNLPKVNKAQIERFRCPLPPIEMQDRFAVFYKQVDKSKMAIQKSLDELETLKKSLMQTYFG